MMKTKILLCVSVTAYSLAGCHSEAPKVRPAVQESTTTVVTPAPVVPTQNVTPTASSPSQTKIVEKAPPENPRVGKFAELDIDHDGQLSKAEFGAGRTPQDAEKWFGRRDTDRDGFLSLAEFAPQSASSPGGKKPEVKRPNQVVPPNQASDQVIPPVKPADK